MLLARACDGDGREAGLRCWCGGGGGGGAGAREGRSPGAWSSMWEAERGRSRLPGFLGALSCACLALGVLRGAAGGTAGNGKTSQPAEPPQSLAPGTAPPPAPSCGRVAGGSWPGGPWPWASVRVSGSFIGGKVGSPVHRGWAGRVGNGCGWGVGVDGEWEWVGE